MNTPQYHEEANNTSGVTWHKSTQKWQASIKIEGNLVNLGFFTYFWEALHARKAAETEVDNSLINQNMSAQE